MPGGILIVKQGSREQGTYPSLLGSSTFLFALNGLNINISTFPRVRFQSNIFPDLDFTYNFPFVMYILIVIQGHNNNNNNSKHLLRVRYCSKLISWLNPLNTLMRIP